MVKGTSECLQLIHQPGAREVAHSVNVTWSSSFVLDPIQGVDIEL